jgi:Domain of Unknown Function (DUF1080)
VARLQKILPACRITANTAALEPLPGSPDYKELNRARAGALAPGVEKGQSEVRVAKTPKQLADEKHSATAQAQEGKRPQPPAFRGRFVPLFNGKDLDGWEKRPEHGGDWKVFDGVLEGRGGGGQHAALITTRRRDFRDFRLRVTLMYSAVYGTGHIQLRRSEAPGKWNGYLVTSGAWWNRTADGQQRKIPDKGTFPVIGSVAKIEGVRSYGPWLFLSKPIPYSYQQWNVIEITALKNRISTKVNNVAVSEYAVDNEPVVSGSIALVCNGTSNVRVRSIEIQEMPSDPSTGSPAGAKELGHSKTP